MVDKTYAKPATKEDIDSHSIVLIRETGFFTFNWLSASEGQFKAVEEKFERHLKNPATVAVFWHVNGLIHRYSFLRG